MNENASRNENENAGENPEESYTSEERWDRAAVERDILKCFREDQHRQILKHQSPRRKRRKRRPQKGNRFFYNLWGAT